jgi:acetyltransferase-like isoleucine patch superfamily enzyme
MQGTELQETLYRENESALKKYMRLTLGKSGLSRLLGYELRILLFGNVPGALGLFLRRLFYRSLFKSMGKNVVLGKGLTIRHPSKISLGNNVAIDDFCALDARGDEESEITIGEKSIIGRNAILRTKNGKIVIGKGCCVGSLSILSSSSTLTIGENTLIASCNYLIAGGQHAFEQVNVPIASQGMISKGGINVGNNVWIGARGTVLDGCSIGDNAIIGACSLVNKSIPDYAIAYGVPAKMTRDRRDNAPSPERTKK